MPRSRTSGSSWPGGWPLLLALGVAVANYFAAVIPLQFLAQLVAPRRWVEMFDQTQVFERQSGVELFLADDRRGRRGAHRRGGHLPRASSCRACSAAGVAVVPAVVASAAIFSLCHVNIVGLPGAVRAGAWCSGCSTSRTRSVLPGMVAHLGSNLTATLLYAAGQGAGHRAGRDLRRSSRRCWRRASSAGWCWPASSRSPGASPAPGAAQPSTRGAPPAGPALPCAGAVGGRRARSASASGAWPTGADSSSTSRTRGSGSRRRDRESHPGHTTDAPSWTRSGRTSAGEAPASSATGRPAGRWRRRSTRRDGGRRAGRASRPVSLTGSLRSPCSRGPGAPGPPSRRPPRRRPRRRRSPPAVLP